MSRYLGCKVKGGIFLIVSVFFSFVFWVFYVFYFSFGFGEEYGLKVVRVK